MTEMIRFQIPGHTRPPLSLNQRGHWAKFHHIKRELRAVCAILTRDACRRAGVQFTPPVRIDLVWVVTDNRRRDADNPAATRKVCVDGVCDALGFDDHWRNVAGGTRIERGDTAGVWVTVESASEVTS